MKYHRLRVIIVFILLDSFLIICSCKKLEVPVVTTTEISNISRTTAKTGGEVTNEGSGTVLSRGVCWSTNTTPTIDDNLTNDGSGAGGYISDITDLYGGTTYYVRAYATNEAGTGYGMALAFKTLGNPPSAPTFNGIGVVDRQLTSVYLVASINANYMATTIVFEYGLSISYGISKTSTTILELGEFESVSLKIDGLLPGTLYHFRVKATNKLGTTLSSDATFTTLGQKPLTTITAAANTTRTSTTLKGLVDANYVSTVVSFEYGVNTNYGSSIDATQNPITGNTEKIVSAPIVNLSEGTTYHFRIKAVNSVGTTYSNDMTFKTLLFGTVSDIESNVYTTVLIGTQTWMQENLKTTRYNDGTLIPNITDNNAWVNTTNGAYCWYNNDGNTYGNLYGALYNYNAVNTGKLCPLGWHVPTFDDWIDLNSYISHFMGGDGQSGGKMKETGTTHWLSPNTGATNESTFTALPAGIMGREFSNINTGCGFWIPAMSMPTVFTLSYNSDSFEPWTYPGFSGFSVRCVKD